MPVRLEGQLPASQAALSRDRAAGGAAAAARTVLGRLGLVGAGLYAANKYVPSGNDSTNFGLPSSGGLGGAERNLHRQLGQLTSDPIGLLFGQSVDPKSDSSDRLLAFSKQVNALRGNLDKLSPQKLQQIQAEAIKLGQDKSLSKYATSFAAVAKVFDPLNVALGKVSGNFTDMASYAGKSMHDILLASKVNMVQIQNTLGAGSEGGRVAVGKNFELAASDIDASMQAGLISVQKGTAEIYKLLAAGLAQVNPNGPTAADLSRLGVAGAQNYTTNLVTRTSGAAPTRRTTCPPPTPRAPPVRRF